MEVISGGKDIKIVDARIGETVFIHLINGKVEKVLLNDITKIGIEGFEVDLRNRPLTFYPFTAIIKVKKYYEIEQG